MESSKRISKFTAGCLNYGLKKRILLACEENISFCLFLKLK